MIPMKELAERVIATLKEGSASINELRSKVGCNKNKLSTTYKKLVREGVVERKKEGTKTILTLKNNERTIAEGFHYLKNTKKLIQIHMKSIEDLKKNNKKLEQKNNEGTYWMHPEPKTHADKIIELLGSLNNISMSYQYLDDFGYAQDYSRKEINNLHKECVCYTKAILRELKKHIRYFYNSYVGSDLFCLKQRIRLDEYFREYQLS
jgi:DNA-binding HxlR family transcriptional regulator